MTTVNLSDKEHDVYTALATRRDSDVYISSLYELVYVDDPALLVTPRRQQQRIGSYVARINRKLKDAGHAFHIVPGNTKRTYRLTNI